MSDPWAAPAGPDRVPPSLGSPPPPSPPGDASVPIAEQPPPSWAAPGPGWVGVPSAGWPATPGPSVPRPRRPGVWLVVLVGALALVFGALLGGVVVALVADDGAVSDDGSVPVSTNIHTVPIGTCFRYAWDSEEFAIDGSGNAVVVAECAEQHDGEVHARAMLGGDTWPGDAQAEKLAYQQCQDAVVDYVGLPYLESEIEVEAWWPGQSEWEDGNRTVTCSLIVYEEGAGSLRDAQR